nr:unnamed protein product [Callosobruchus chinensis]
MKTHFPDSDCNSNHHGSVSYLSNTSSQDVDFIQDNSDYQWFLDYGWQHKSPHQHLVLTRIVRRRTTAKENVTPACPAL